MTKEKVFIILFHRHSLKKGTKNEWEVTETVEFVNQLRNKHFQTSSAIADYINRKMLSGSRFGMGDYDVFEKYINSKYSRQMEELDSSYKSEQIFGTDKDIKVTDEFGNEREKTVFDS